MKLARFNHPLEKDKKEDIDRLISVFSSYGIMINPETVASAWSLYSEKKGSEWEPIPEKDDDIYLAIIEYLYIVEY